MGNEIDTPIDATLDPVVNEAMERLTRCMEWESPSRERFIDDLKFAEADADNGYQWPNAIRRARDVDQRPCLTINVTRQHILQIINEGEQSKQECSIRPTGNGATKESADVLKAIIRHIHSQSRADQAYKTARNYQVKSGIGYWRIVTDYAGPDTFDQEIYIRRIWDPLSVYLDPDIKELDGSDAKFGFVFDVLSSEQFKKDFPKFASKASLSPLGASTTQDLIQKDHVMVCEYFRKVAVLDELVNFVDSSTGERKSIKKSKVTPEIWESLVADPLSRVREVEDEKIEWYLIVAEEVVDHTTWPGKYIPLIRCIGEETVIQGELDRKGHTRALKDAQRMFNYNSSSQVEFVALQNKTPWVAPLEAMEDLETYWNTANLVNHAVLPFKHIDDQGNPIPPPQRTTPPVAAPAYQAGMDTAFNQMMMASGQWQNQMGMMGNERTGRAIQERQEQGDTATFHFHDNFRDALLNTTRQLIDLIPKIYDTRRVLKIFAEDGTDFDVEIDPGAAQALAIKTAYDQRIVRRIFSPNVGTYEVIPDTGPSLGTKRKETAEALTLILTQNPGLTGIIGDLLLDTLDFEKAQEAAQRLKRMVPPQALGQGPSPQEQALQAQVQQLQALLTKALQKHGVDQVKLKGKEEMRDIEVYEAETRRMQALQGALPTDPEGLQALIQQLVQDAISTNLQSVLGGAEQDLGRGGRDLAITQPP